MKIAFLTPEYPHPVTGYSGGIGTSIKNLAKGLIQKGCTVRILVYGQKQDAIFEEEGIIVQQIKNVKFKGLSWYLTRKKLQRIIDDLYQDNQIDIVEAPDWTGISSYIKPNNCPLVIRLHGSDTYFCHLEQRPVKWKNKFHERRALEKADGLISVSRFTAEKTNEVFDLDRKFVVIPNSIDMENFSCSLSGQNMKADTILYFGSLIRKKGLLELPWIFNEVISKKPDAKLVLVGRDVRDIKTGNPSTWQMMEKLFSAEALKKVSYLGAVPYHEIKKQIENAGICVFPSFAEALPVSWIEAMAMQKPIVASNVGWATEVIDDGKSGFLVHPANHKKYAGRILQLLQDNELRVTLGKEAAQKVTRQFSIEVIAEQSIKFYQQSIRR